MAPKIPHTTEEGIEKKRCGTCKAYHPLSDFGKNSSSWDKLHVRCRQSENAKKTTDHGREVMRTYMAKRRATNAQQRIYDRIASNMYSALKSGNSAKFSLYLYCTIDEFKAHMESLYTEGMNWENRGGEGWAIDHVIPCTFFDLTDEEELRACYHYKNTQPMWRSDNISKGNKITEEIFEAHRARLPATVVARIEDAFKATSS